MRIAICDDERECLVELSEIVEEYINHNNVDISYKLFQSFDDLYDAIDQFDLFFLDCKMQDIDGIEFAKIIRKRFNEEKGIVFITAYSDFVYDAFEVRTHRYLLKPIQEDKVFDAIDDYLKISSYGKKLVVKSDGHNNVVNLKNVYYIEACRKTTYIYFNDDFISCHRTIASLEEELSTVGFYRAHRSYLVNFDKVKSFDKRFIQLDNGEKISISPQKYSDFSVQYLKYISKHKI